MFEKSADFQAYFPSIEDPDRQSGLVLSDKPDFEYKGYYKFGRVLGRGRFGTVIECLRKVDNLPIALKFFKCSEIHRWIPEAAVIDSEETEFKHSEFFDSKRTTTSHNSVASSITSENRVLPSEVACLISATHIPGVVKILDYLPASDDVQTEPNDDFEKLNDDAIIGIVLERNLNEMCLFDYLIQRQVLDEEEARFIIKQLVKINLDLLQAGILHGDLKSENILIEPKTKLIKLIDFGSAQLTNDLPHLKTTNKSIATKLIKTFRGTNLYKPPEYLIHKCFYPRPSTIWTIGVILYDMVCGFFPFDNDAEVMNHQHKEVEFPSDRNLSPEFKNLVKRCLAFYVADRINIDKILLDQWMID